jgi:hypothetical protein
VVHNGDADDKVGGSLAVRKGEAIRNSNVDIGDPRIELGAVLPRATQLSPGELNKGRTPVGTKQVNSRVNTQILSVATADVKTKTAGLLGEQEAGNARPRLVAGG